MAWREHRVPCSPVAHKIRDDLLETQPAENHLGRAHTQWSHQHPWRDFLNHQSSPGSRKRRFKHPSIPPQRHRSGRPHRAPARALAPSWSPTRRSGKPSRYGRGPYGTAVGAHRDRQHQRAEDHIKWSQERPGSFADCARACGLARPRGAGIHCAGRVDDPPFTLLYQGSMSLVPGWWES